MLYDGPQQPLAAGPSSTACQEQPLWCRALGCRTGAGMGRRGLRCVLRLPLLYHSALCLAAGQNDFGISRQKGEGPPIQLIVYPGAYLKFDIPMLRRPINYFGHHIEFNQSVTDQSSQALHKFFQSVIDSRR